MTNDIPRLIVAVTVWAYWVSVVVLVIRNHLRYRTSAGGLPRTGSERWMWIGWVPAVLLWQILPALASSDAHPLLALPAAFMNQPATTVVRWIASGAAVLAYMLTIPCWLSMGRDWSMAVVPRKRSRLVTHGMFARVRHPIYALSILLMLATVVVVPSPAMILIGAVHLVMLYLKTIGEERYLRQRHGQQYADYCLRTGRFMPRVVGKVGIST